jgi:hypothetical protein
VELAEVSEFRSPYLSVRETVEFWEVSERTLRRRLASGAPDCHQDESGQWCLSVEWVDAEFHRRRHRRPVIAENFYGDGQEDNLSASDPIESDTTIDLRTPPEPSPSDEWVQELLEAERRATRAETELKILKVQLERNQTELMAAKSDLSYERSLVNRLKDQFRDSSPD